MASTIKQRLRRYNGTDYDTIHLETEKSMITDFPSSMPASDVYSWAKASSKPSYTYSEVGAAASSHTHAAGDITSGTLAVARGGTGATTAAQARTNLGISGIGGVPNWTRVWTSGTLTFSGSASGSTSGKQTVASVQYTPPTIDPFNYTMVKLKIIATYANISVSSYVTYDVNVVLGIGDNSGGYSVVVPAAPSSLSPVTVTRTFNQQIQWEDTYIYTRYYYQRASCDASGSYSYDTTNNIYYYTSTYAKNVGFTWYNTGASTYYISATSNMGKNLSINATVNASLEVWLPS